MHSIFEHYSTFIKLAGQPLRQLIYPHARPNYEEKEAKKNKQL